MLFFRWTPTRIRANCNDCERAEERWGKAAAAAAFAAALIAT
eukprot:gene14285-11679_t